MFDSVPNTPLITTDEVSYCPANIYLFNRNTRKRYEICSELTIKTPERRQWRRSGDFVVNFEHILHILSGISIVKLEQVNVSWVAIKNHY